MRILVTGGRDYGDANTVGKALSAVHRKHGIELLIEGGARGADRLSREWAKSNNVAVATFNADWNAHGKGAGHIRNQQMLSDGMPDALIAFPGGRGTADMTRRCEAAGLPIWRVG